MELDDEEREHLLRKLKHKVKKMTNEGVDPDVIKKIKTAIRRIKEIDEDRK